MAKSRQIIAIVAMNPDRVIGKDGGLPWHYSEDLKRFKRKTLNAAVIMGRKTWQSIGSKSLPQRRNIVISRSRLVDVECYTSVGQAIDQVNDDIWIIGGAQIYNSALEYCDAVDVTWVADRIEGSHLVRFAELDPAIWRPDAKIVNELDSRLKHQLYHRVRNDKNTADASSSGH